LRLIASFRTLQPLDIREILHSADHALVSDQISNTQDWDFLSHEFGHHATSPDIIETDGINACENVNAQRRNADPKHEIGEHKIGVGKIQQQRTKCGQRPDHSLRIRGIRPNRHTQITRGTNPPVRRTRIGSNDQVFNAVSVEF